MGDQQPNNSEAGKAADAADAAVKEFDDAEREAFFQEQALRKQLAELEKKEKEAAKKEKDAER